MSHVSLIAANKPFPLCDHREYREKTHGKYTVGFDMGFYVEEHNYYHDAVEELGFPMKPYQYEFGLENCETDLNHLTGYLRENLSAGEEVELWALWVGDGPGKLRRYRGKLIEDAKLFDRAQKGLVEYMKSYSADDPSGFAEDFRADLKTVLETYRFRHKWVSIQKIYEYDPPEDCLSVAIGIDDNEGCCCCTYRAFFDFDLNCIDDSMGG